MSLSQTYVNMFKHHFGNFRLSANDYEENRTMLFLLRQKILCMYGIFRNGQTPRGSRGPVKINHYEIYYIKER